MSSSTETPNSATSLALEALSLLYCHAYIMEFFKAQN